MATDARFYSDDPIDATPERVDMLDRKVYAERVCALLERVHRASESSVLGLIGPWGSGKSSVLLMIRAWARSRSDWTVSEFNPWTYSDLHSMLLGFFDELTAALPDGTRPGDTRRQIGRFIEKISPLGSAGGILGVDAQSALSALGNFVKGDATASAERARMDEFLRSQDRAVLVLIDDLDRLSPMELLLVFKLVRFLGRLPNVYYILAYDEKTLLDVLSLTELCGGDGARARDYLEKIVQLRLDLPPLSLGSGRDLLDAGIRDILPHGSWEDDRGLALRFWALYPTCLRDSLRTPRAINRYLAQLAAFWDAESDSIMDWFDYALITFLRTFAPLVYSLVWQSRDFVVAVNPVDSISRGPESEYSRFIEKLGNAAASSGDIPVDRLETMLGEVFLPLSTTGGGRITKAQIEGVKVRGGAGSLESFDRYFSFSK
ncbi:KAP-like P-loop domain-containing protein [Humibacillus xanthopallidus]|uniref:KAP-like P-loop domain-containing protein n=1 Tax=Humibacillus xanthopallidus TaxID=412689 RepID=A0A543PUA1_9MICO|nr:P-loop NTPase fold protein [Humibacillus xanthopallidus]TQN47665.1 KAP-like P-loop domain-containing protein [Humibacillus xanthopallidus]